MAIDFPDNPSINDTYSSNGRTWLWDGVSWRGRTAGYAGSRGPQGPQGPQGYTGSNGTSASVTTSITAPVSPVDGDLWWSEEEGQLKIYYNDGNSSQWVDSSSGMKGDSGYNGSVGAQGPQGPQGYTGSSALPIPTASTTTSTASLSWNSDSFDMYIITAQAEALVMPADSGTPAQGRKMLFRIKDDGTARAISWTTGASKAFRALGVTLPTTTIVSKTVYVGCVYNSTDSRWDVVAVSQEV